MQRVLAVSLLTSWSFEPLQLAPIVLLAVDGTVTTYAFAEPRDPAMGSDLRGAKRAPKVAIDMENPYQ